MDRYQSSALRSFRRVREFLAANEDLNTSGHLSDEIAELEDVIHAMSEVTREQNTVSRLGLSETQRQQELRDVVWEKFMLPISRVAREVFGAPGVDLALRLPKKSSDHDRIVGAARGMADAAEKHLAAFGRKLNMERIAELRVAANELEASLGTRVETHRRRVTATESLRTQVKRGRRIVRTIHALIQPELKPDVNRWIAWRFAKRPQEPMGGRVGAPPADAEKVA